MKLFYRFALSLKPQTSRRRIHTPLIPRDLFTCALLRLAPQPLLDYRRPYIPSPRKASLGSVLARPNDLLTVDFWTGSPIP
jgi:hypothetical protein